MNVRLIFESVEIKFWNFIIPWMYKSKLLDFVIYKGFEFMEGTTMKDFAKRVFVVGLIGVILGFIGGIILTVL